MPPTDAPLPERVAEFRARFATLETEVGKVIVGQRVTVRGVLMPPDSFRENSATRATTSW